jgi:hypothetical protein
MEDGVSPSSWTRPGVLQPMQAKRLLLALLALLTFFIQGCGRIFVYQTPTPVGPGMHYAIDRRFLFNHLVLANSYVSEEIRKLPKEDFQDIQGAHLNCWRFETGDGRRFTAKAWRIEQSLEGTIILRRESMLSDKKDRPARALEIDRIVSLWPIPLRKGEEIILAERMTRDDAGVRIVDIQGRQHLAAPGEAHLIELETEPDYSAYGFDKQGEATGLSASSIDEFLREPGKIVKADEYASVPLSEIKRWEFEKEWPPTAYFVTFAIMLPLQAAALESNPGEPSRCPWD